MKAEEIRRDYGAYTQAKIHSEIAAQLAEINLTLKKFAALVMTGFAAHAETEDVARMASMIDQFQEIFKAAEE